MFDFESVRKWRRGEDTTNALAFVDGAPLYPTTAGVSVGSAAYVLSENDRQFAETIPRLDIEAVFLYGSRVTNLVPLLSLKRLKHLRIDWAIKLTDISALANLSSLESLHFWDTPKLEDLGPVASLKALTYFGFEGGIWNKNTAQSLEPLAELPNLQAVLLHYLKIKEGSLKPLIQCAALRRLEVSNQYDIKDLAYLSVVRPDIECILFSGCFRTVGGAIMMTGKGKSNAFLDPVADVERIQVAEAAFSKLQSQIRAQLKL